MDTAEGRGASSSKSRLIYVNGDCAGILWPVLSSYLSFIEDDEPQLYTMDSLFKSVMKGEMQLWAIGSDMDYVASGLTQIIRYPANTILEIVGCGGRDMDAWVELIEKLKAWGEMQGCTVLRVIGRKGWTRLLKDYNFNGERAMISAPIGR